MDTLEVLAERIAEIKDDVKSLAKSYKVLNDHSHKQDLAFTRLETERETDKAWIRWILGSSLIGTVIGVLSLLKTFGLI